jgi:hypothetical protein
MQTFSLLLPTGLFSGNNMQVRTVVLFLFTILSLCILPAAAQDAAPAQNNGAPPEMPAKPDTPPDQPAKLPEEKSEKDDFGFFLSITPLCGYEYGQIDELTYSADSSGKNQKSGELNWEIKPSFYAGGMITGGWKFISLSGYFTGTIPGDCGSLYNSDWYNLDDTKTCYSYSDNTLTRSFQWGANLTVSLPLGDKCALAASAAFDYKTISFSAANGKGWYGELNSSTDSYYAWNSSYVTTTSFSGKTVNTYDWSGTSWWYGISLLLTPNKKLSVMTSASISPYSYIYAQDYHCLTGYTYTDTMEGKNSIFKFEMNASALLSWRFYFYSDLTIFLSKEIYGTDEYSGNSSTDIQSTGTAGTKINDCRVSLGVSFRIF